MKSAIRALIRQSIHAKEDNSRAEVFDSFMQEDQHMILKEEIL